MSAKRKRKPKDDYLTHLTSRGKKQLVMTLAAIERKKGVSQSVALKRAWRDMKQKGFLD